MGFMDLNKDSLVKAAKFYKVDVDEDATKQNITNALLDAGKTPEQWEHDQEAYEHGLGAEETGETVTTSSLQADEVDEDEDFDFADEEETQEEPEETSKKAEPEEKEMVLVRFTGNNASYTAGSLRFSKNKPFALMSRDQFEDLNQDKFRLANRKEAEEFYGR